MHTVPTCTNEHSDYTKLNFHSLEQAADRLEMDKDSSMEQKTGRVYSLGKRYVFKLHFKDAREGFCWRGRGRSFHVDRPKTKKVREPTVPSGETCARNLEAENI